MKEASKLDWFMTDQTDTKKEVEGERGSKGKEKTERGFQIKMAK